MYHIVLHRHLASRDALTAGDSWRLRSKLAGRPAEEQMLFPATVTALLAGTVMLVAPVLPAQAQSCRQLWVERNAYYKGPRPSLQVPAGDRLFRQWRMPDPG